jgi:hypothetical protein
MGVFILALFGGGSSEPVYQGKTLSLSPSRMPEGWRLDEQLRRAGILYDRQMG